MRWFEKNGRDLPWRHTRDPYAILVSEFMLQQTQVVTVIAYYERWMKRFPSWTTLADADEQEVLAHWQGLGYYARARNLLRAAIEVRGTYGGQLPVSTGVLRSLPGVGPYTAGAVASFAWDLPEPIVDANIERVLSRIHDVRILVDTADGKQKIWALAAEHLPEKRPGHFNAALMELGAIVCLSRQPKCASCPVRRWCLCLSGKGPEGLPAKKARKKTVHLVEDRALILKKEWILLQRETGKRWHGLWRLPDAPCDGELLHSLRYPITHHQILMQIRRGMVPEGLEAEQQWFDLKAIEHVPMPAPHRRAVVKLCAFAPSKAPI